MLGVLAALVSNRIPPEVTMMAAMVVVLLAGVITPEQALAGFANPGLMTVAALYVVAAALRDTGSIFWIAQKLLGQPRTQTGSLLRMILPTSLLSAFLNNTTVVAMMIPAVQEWGQRLKLPVSHLLLPLSYAAILGGTCTLIGTSTNLVVDGMMQNHGNAGLSYLCCQLGRDPRCLLPVLRFCCCFRENCYPHVRAWLSNWNMRASITLR